MRKENIHKHWDAWGNPILDHFQMMVYYRDSPKDLYIVTHYLPHQIVIIPSVEIRIFTGTAPIVEVTLMYPGGDQTKVVQPCGRVWEALRRTWRDNIAWKHDYRGMGQIVIARKGKVILDPGRKFGQTV